MRCASTNATTTCIGHIDHGRPLVRSPINIIHTAVRNECHPLESRPGESCDPGGVSPVSKGRKRKPRKGGRRTDVRGDQTDVAGTPPDLRSHELGVDLMAYLDDLSQDASPAEVEDTLDRRVFTMPYSGATINDEDLPELDPADPDERGLLIQGEHPEYHEAVTDPAWEGAIDGVNPRLHLIFHEIIANQLWADDPPEVWQAARRLREEGMDRHDVLHALAAVMAEHVHFVLAHEEPSNPDAYRRALDALGRDT